jgi:hypothetical protein
MIVGPVLLLTLCSTEPPAAAVYVLAALAGAVVLLLGAVATIIGAHCVRALHLRWLQDVRRRFER